MRPSAAPMPVCGSSSLGSQEPHLILRVWIRLYCREQDGPFIYHVSTAQESVVFELEVVLERCSDCAVQLIPAGSSGWMPLGWVLKVEMSMNCQEDF